MDIRYPGFGAIVVDGKTYDHDVVIGDGEVRARDKTPSRPLKRRFGHTPLSAGEDIPLSKPTLVIGSGYSGRLPVLPEVEEVAARHEVELRVIPTADAVRLLSSGDLPDVNAILHVTC